MKNKKSFRDFAVVGTQFSQYEKEYFLNKDNHLEEYPVLRDCQEYINSNYETVYQKILDNLMHPSDVVINDSDAYVQYRETNRSKLDIMLEANKLLDEYRKENPDFKGSVNDFIGVLNKNIKKGFEQYEKEVHAREKSEQEKLSPNGEEGA